MKKWAIITGASSGIGKAFIPFFLEDGVSVIAIARDKDKLKKVAQEYKHLGEVNCVSCDLANREAVRDTFGAILSSDIRIHALVNNAGVGDGGYFLGSDRDRQSRIIDVNIHALTMITHQVLPHLQRGSKILNVSSTAAFQPGPSISVYYASKSYVLQFSRALRYELRDSGISVTTLCPGPTKTGFKDSAQMTMTKLSESRFTLSAQDVAASGYQAMKKGKDIVIPGLLNKLLVFVGHILPSSIAMKSIDTGSKKD